MASKKKTTMERKATAGRDSVPAGAGNVNENGTRGAEGDGPAFFEEMVAQRILACVGSLGGKFGRNKLAGILVGVASNYILEHALEARPHYGTLSRFSRREVLAMMDQLTGRGLLRIEGGEFPRIVLTDEGLEALRDGAGARVRLPYRLEPRPVPVPADATLFGLLRELRNNLAREEDLPVYCVFDNRTLLAVTEARPTCLESLAEVKGFSDVRMEKYGEKVVKLVADYVASGGAGPDAGDDGTGAGAGAAEAGDDAAGAADDSAEEAAGSYETPVTPHGREESDAPGGTDGTTAVPRAVPAGPGGVPGTNFRSASEMARASGLL